MHNLVLKSYCGTQARLWQVKQWSRDLAKHEGGAAMIEYSVLVGIIAVGTIAATVLVSSWMTTRWAGLNATLSGAP